MNLTELDGKNVLVRTVTNYYTGCLVLPDSDQPQTWLELRDAAWIADTGRFSDALKTGKLEEVEPYPGTCYVAAGAVVDVCEWPHELPRSQK